MKKRFAPWVLAAVAGAVITLATRWRESSWTVWSSEKFWDFLSGSNYPYSLIDTLIDAAFLTLVLRLLWTLIARLAWLRSARRSANSSEMVGRHSLVVSDAAIGGAGQDALSRAHTANDVIDLLVAQPGDSSYVVGIEGAWGQGKSSLIALVREGLAAHASLPILVMFDPWPEDSKRGVVARMFDSISAAIRRSPLVDPTIRADVGSVLREIGDSVAKEIGWGLGALVRATISWVSGNSNWSIRDPLNSLVSERERLGLALGRLDRRLVVIIDDLDRVDSGELRAVLMTVNAFSQLPNISFLLAFDPDVVDEIMSAGGFVSASGAPFREKIVTVSVQLPVANFVNRAELYRSAVEQVIRARQLGDTWDAWDGVARVNAEKLAVTLVRSPRGLKRLANHVGIVLSRLGREIHCADLILLELLRTQCPRTWQKTQELRFSLDPNESFIDQNEALADGQQVFDNTAPARRLGKNAPEPKTPLDQLIASAPDHERLDAERILRVLFPQAGDRDQFERDSRVVVGRNLRKYFALSVEGTAVADEKVRQLIQEPGIRAAMFEKHLRAASMSIFLFRISRLLPDVVPEPRELIFQVLQAARDSWLRGGENVTDEASELIRRIVARTPEADRAPLLMAAVGSRDSISVGHDVLLDLLQDAGLWENGKLITANASGESSRRQWRVVSNEVLLDATRVWLDAAWATGLGKILRTEPEPLAIFYRMGQLEALDGEPFNKVQAELAVALRDDVSFRILVSQYSTAERGRSIAVEGLERLVGDWAKFAERVAALKEPKDAIEKIEEYRPPPAQRPIPS